MKIPQLEPADLKAPTVPVPEFIKSSLDTVLAEQGSKVAYGLSMLGLIDQGFTIGFLYCYCLLSKKLGELE